ncbi:unnamed protein product [Vicia faba]|uniref:Uncharacterized protein n=1 Tax=Vicia faba TaxID=3906 RepID=A0AAV1ALN4_VICFA|nr:unnamed protein product [Vicia faba]
MSYASIMISWLERHEILKVRKTSCACRGIHELSPGGRPQKFLRGSLKEKAQLLMSVGKYMDVARLIANELKKVALNGTKIGDRTPCQLTYPGLIMGLCNRARVFIPSVGYQQFYLYVGNPQVPHPLGTLEEFIAFANWSEGRPNVQEEAASDDEEEESKESIFDLDSVYDLSG